MNLDGLTISPVKQILTKRGTPIDSTTNASDDIDWSLLENYDFPPDKPKAGMDQEMASLRDFDVFTESTTKSMVNSGTIIPTRWVLKWKGNDVKARICAKGFVQRGLDRDSIFASTPALSTAKVLLSLAASQHWKCPN